MFPFFLRFLCGENITEYGFSKRTDVPDIHTEAEGDIWASDARFCDLEKLPPFDQVLFYSRWYGFSEHQVHSTHGSSIPLAYKPHTCTLHAC